MPTTITSSLVNAFAAGTYVLPIIPGRLMCVTAKVTSAAQIASGTVTPGQVIQMIPIPTGCELVDFWMSSEWPGNAAGVFTVGDGSSTSRYVTAASLTATSRITRASSNLGYKYSVSDDATTRFDTIDVNIGAGATQTSTGSILMVAYFRYLDETTNDTV